MPDSSLLCAPVHSAVLRNALPGMTGMIAASAGTLTDALLLSRQSAALSAAVSVSFSLLTLIQTLGFTLGMGAGSFVSRSIGRDDRPAAFAAASTAFYGALALAVFLFGAGLLLAQPLVRLLGAADAAAAAAYARYVLLSGPLLCASLVLSSLLRAQGKNWINMIAFLTGAAIGIPLQILLVSTLQYGIHGAGCAMLAREGVTFFVLAAATAKNKQLVRPALRAFSLRRAVLRSIMQSGLPTLVRQGLISVSSVLLTRACAAFGEAALGGMGLAVRAAAMASSAAIGFGQGFQPVCGVSFGAGDMERVRKAYTFSLRCVMIGMSMIGAAVFILAAPILSVFDPQEEVLSFAVCALRVQSAVFFAQGAVIMMNMLTQAMGLTLRASVIAASRQGFVFIPLILVLPHLFGEAGLILCQSVSDLVSLPLCFLIARPAIRDSSCARGGCWDARKASR